MIFGSALSCQRKLASKAIAPGKRSLLLERVDAFPGAIALDASFRWHDNSIIFFATLLLSLWSSIAFAHNTDEQPPQTKSLTLAEVETIFLEKNLDLIASKFNIEASKGVAIQAGLWNNPSVTIEQSIMQLWQQAPPPGYDTEVWFQQMFVIAKRDKAAQIAEEDTKIATHSFYNTLRSLKFQLRKSFYTLYFAQKTLAFYDTSISRLKAAVKLPADLHVDGSDTVNERLRFKTLLVTFENERLDVLRQINELRGTLRIMLGEIFGSNVEIVPVVDEDALLEKRVAYSKDEAIEKAKQNRQDLQVAKTQIERAQLNVSLQKLGWVPNFTLGLHYSKSGGFAQDYVGLTLSFDLPFVDHSQGNLQAAKAAVQMQARTRDLALLKVENEVKIAHDNAQKTDELLKEVGPNYTKNLGDLVREKIRGYQQRRIGIIEFTDFYEAHRTSIVQLNQLHAKRLVAFEELNYAVGAD